MAPNSFGPYQLIAKIGGGGSDEVYRAFDTRRQRTVALKRLHPDLAVDEKFRARFLRECHLTARLTEAHIIPIHDFGEIDGRLYLDMRLVEGGNLADALAAAGRFSPGHAVEIVRQVAGALDATHAAGIVHRNVKRSNVLIGTSEPILHCYLAGFGVVGEIDETGGVSGTATGGVLGTYDYIAPERLLGRPPDYRVDVYALACLLFELVTGVPPFRNDEVASMIHAHLNVEPPRASRAVAGIPPMLDAVIARGMAKDPRARYTSAGELAETARSVVRDRPMRALSEGAASVDMTSSTGSMVFLCHSSGDKERVRRLYRQLESDGVHCWFDEEDLMPGDDWDREITRAIRQSKYVLACLSRASITKRGYVQKELRKALDVADEQPEGVAYVIPVRLEECEVPDRLGRWHWVDLFEYGSYERLVRRLKA